MLYPPLADVPRRSLPWRQASTVPGTPCDARLLRAGHGRLGPPFAACVRNEPATAPDPHMVTLATRPLAWIGTPAL